MDLFRPETPGYELWIALAAWAAFVVGLLLLRVVWEVLYYGPRAVLRNGFHVDSETWRLIAILIFFGIAGMTVWFQWL
ncbi:MAG TPA: hypothetical protein VF950_15135 [Planctomycetota bacterium]